MRPAVLAGVLALACACSSGPEAIHVRSVRVVDAADAGPALGEAGLDAAALEEAVRAALGSAGFRLGDGRRPHAAGIDLASLRIVPGGSVGPRAEIALEVVLRPAEEGPPARSERGSASVPISAFRSPAEAWRRALTDAAGHAAQGLAASVRAEAKGAEDLIADLASKDARVREEAVRVLGERRSRQAVPALIARLDKEEPRVAHKVIGALGQIGDERAIPALIELSHATTDAALTARLVRFIGDIGGAEAEGYLLTLSSGHPDRRVRAAAREALDELSQRAKEAPVAARSDKMPAP
jgi:hypothetical protein